MSWIGRRYKGNLHEPSASRKGKKEITGANCCTRLFVAMIVEAFTLADTFPMRK